MKLRQGFEVVQRDEHALVGAAVPGARVEKGHPRCCSKAPRNDAGPTEATVLRALFFWPQASRDNHCVSDANRPVNRREGDGGGLGGRSLMVRLGRRLC